VRDRAAAPSKRSGTIPAALAVTGGVVAVAGAMMAWASASATIPGEGKKAVDVVVSTSVKGTSTTAGIAVAGLGVVLIILGLAFLLGTGAAGSRMGRLKAAVIPGLLILGVVAFAFVSKDSLVKSGWLSSAGASGVAASDAGSLFSQLSSSGALVTTLGAGVMVAAAGGLIGVAAGVVSLVGGRGRR
jgi:hypothetical protein